MQFYLSCSVNYTANQEAESSFHIWSVVVRYKNVIETIFQKGYHVNFSLQRRMWSSNSDHTHYIPAQLALGWRNYKEKGFFLIIFLNSHSVRKTSLSVISTDFFLKRNWGRPYRYVGSKNLSQIHVRIHKPVKKKVCNRKPRPSLWVPYWMLELRVILTQRPKKLRVQGLDFLQPLVSL